MIKINLLNAYNQATKELAGTGSDSSEQRIIVIDALKRVLALAIGPGCLIIYELQSIPVLEAKLVDVGQRYNELKQFNDSKQKLAEEIKKYEETQARFNAQMDFINKIDREKVNEYKLFELLKTSTPEKVWINKLEVFESTLLINAESIDAREIEKFIQKMSNSDFISNLSPLNQAQKKSFQLLVDTNLITTSFQLKATLISRGKP